MLFGWYWILGFGPENTFSRLQDSPFIEDGDVRMALSLSLSLVKVIYLFLMHTVEVPAELRSIISFLCNSQ